MTGECGGGGVVGEHDCLGIDTDVLPDAFLDDAVEAVEEYLTRRQPLSRREFDELRGRFAREPGEPFDVEGVGRNVHVRRVGGEELGAWVADTDVALVDRDDRVEWADLHGVPVASGGREGIVPVVVAASGEPALIRHLFHRHYHALEDVRDGFERGAASGFRGDTPTVDGVVRTAGAIDTDEPAILEGGPE